MSDADRTHDDAAAEAALRPASSAHPAQPDAAQTDAGRSETTEPEAAPQPLTSLSSLLGGSYAGGQACDADGSCD
ncbi:MULTISPECIES: hypothetical protein [Brachybacterium]|uniref:Uncharacterized protein n=2 Tax=Brachybacterium TaxID=43668 RepID=A0A3R8RP68_9MICO|nr:MULTISPECIES: hypothetical protein [Brachybacterium]RRR17202.1 hypothetical protein DS079_15590 [Brachybacterium paraconglomeratum]GLI29439.1 hypothetical protein BCONGLO52_02800 [Brachybacterium conglomeratum]GLK06078.1 hypothetical protein GCM10017597_28780 [Brachybacterium conglomeratum]